MRKELTEEQRLRGNERSKACKRRKKAAKEAEREAKLKYQRERKQVYRAKKKMERNDMPPAPVKTPARDLARTTPSAYTSPPSHLVSHNSYDQHGEGLSVIFEEGFFDRSEKLYRIDATFYIFI